MKINDLLLGLTKEKYLNRWIIFLIVFITIEQPKLIRNIRV